MVRNLDKEYKTKNIIYQQQKEYRDTPEGREALRRANKKWRDSKRMDEVRQHPAKKECDCCGERIMEFLSVKDDKITCFNCKNQIKCPHKEIEQVCQ